MTGSEVRSRFLTFFEERGHRVVPSSSVVPKGDPTLMFVNAGMVPFKRVFTGEEKREYSRATSAQRCMRVSGKHNDLEEVGRSPSHHTAFEMLGNFSFGDYFKQDAIEYAWELVTGVYGLAEDRLVVSVLDSDDEAYGLWRDRIGLPGNRIFRLPEKENFWQMGESGPCGPCSELHVILDDEAFRAGADPSMDGFLEFYNLVFMQFEQSESGERKPLPKPSVDTGLGLERMSALLQGVSTNYDTDLFQPMIARAAEISGVAYGARHDSDVSLQVTADHARACVFLIGDGVLPSNEGRGYVLRRVLRRAARHGVLLGVEEPFLYDVVGVVIDCMGDAYPELRERRAFIERTVRQEEERFSRTLGRGLHLLDQEIERAQREQRVELSADVVFKLYDTYGFPTDLTEDILRARGLEYDRPGFDDRMREQAERARAAWKGSGETRTGEAYRHLAGRVQTRFVGYEGLEASSPVALLLRDAREVSEVLEGDRVEVVVETSPFYAESGGQVGDVGTIHGPGGRMEVDDTQRPLEGLVVHRGRVALGSLRLGEEVRLVVDADRRAATVRNHSGTHVLHWALRQVLGEHVTQAGSLVGPNRLRFDITHDGPLAEDEIQRIEDLANDLIFRNVPAEVEQKPYAAAIKDGAIAMFQEKYGEDVRVVRFGPSLELCGGTHARATGDIGCIRIVGQSALGAGVRRIEAQTGFGVIEAARREARLLRESAELLRVAPAELAERLRRLLEREKTLSREVEKLRAELRRSGTADPLAGAREVAGVKLIVTEVEGADPKQLRSMIDELKQRIGSGVVVLGTRSGGKAALAVGVTKDLTNRFRAGDLVKRLAEAVGGSGGGRPDFAQAGGPRADDLPRALEGVDALIAS